MDVHLHQVVNVPKLHIDVDQTRARELGLTQQDVADSVLVSLSGSGQVLPNYWVDPSNGHLVPRRDADADATSSTASMPINGLPLRVASSGATLQLLANVAKVERGVTPEVVNHTNVQPTFDVYANVQGRDLGSVAREIDRVLDEYRAEARRRATRSRCAARSRAWSRRSSGWAWASSSPRCWSTC